ncbi:hypothetical protein NEMBOFW57_009392 [Staphylotrichum longicolle]|uniref:C2H2-type domain-containing protein n=1 Tax=Staphylotrichum longicolle TaxID=669026 RepID=A0AAD4EPE6_9PEZI|nr:hypothetical protein NEMBOFW57_009392 [Staphylotrichum longicolle]
MLAAQTNVQAHPLDYGHYADDTANQAYWQTDSAQAGPSFDPSNTDHPLMCTHEGCPKAGKVYNRKCDFDKHMNNHNKRRRCNFCDGGGAETKDLNRHMWTRHPNEARAFNIPKDEVQCPMCDYSGRSDNVKRHRDTKGHW